MNNPINLRITLDLSYAGDGDDAASIEDQLRQAFNRCIQRENLLGGPESFSIAVASGPDTLAPLALTDVLERAERFISGFEDDQDQEGVPAILAGLRGQLAKVEPAIIEAVKDGITYAVCVLSNWESGDLAGAVNQLGFWVEKYGQNAFSADNPLHTTLADGLAAARSVEGNWEKGDLAGAVQVLSGWANTARTKLCELGLLKPIAVVEISGGLVRNVTGAGGCDVLVVDYDNGEDDDSLPHIPSYGLDGYESQASIEHYASKGSEHRAWCEAVADLAEHE